jgi:hypothetical protein
MPGRRSILDLLAATLCSLLAGPAGLAAESRVLDPAMHHLRRGAPREWADFPEVAEAPELVLWFDAAANPAERTLRLRHRDLKQAWVVRLNGEPLATLPRDEQDVVTHWAVPAGLLRDGANELRVGCPSKVPAVPPAEGASDDVLIGEVALIDAPRAAALSEATVDVTVLDADGDAATPCRITVVDHRGVLASLGNPSDARLAVRPGVVYAADGRAKLSLPAGRYTLYAGRGFAYSLDEAAVDLRPGDAAARTLRVRKVVPTDGLVAADTHVHTFTFSRHGDATADERMLTLAGEGIELPVATDHNVAVDYDAAAAATGTRRRFTPVLGVELTTPALGHFNVFPLPGGGKLPDWRAPAWAALRRSIDQAAPGGGIGIDGPVVVLNHARDLHGGFRPFDPARHVSLTGEDLDGWDLPANAMEVINSAATQTDPMVLYRDWFGMLNRGVMLTPVGASDSHDVSRYIVGQARTYVRVGAADPGHVDVARAARAMREGRVLVSYGLLADVVVAGRFRPGDVVPAAAVGPDGLAVTARVLGPAWARATRVTLFANGVPIHEEAIGPGEGEAGGRLEAAGVRLEPTGVKWERTWTLSRPRHDLWLAVVATGPGVAGPHWPTAKPYQPASPEWSGYVLGSTGAVRVDADGSGGFDSAFDYADRAVRAAGGDVARAAAGLATHDQAAAAQAAARLRRLAPDGFEGRARAATADAAPAVRAGFEQFLAAWAESEAARAAKVGRATGGRRPSKAE